MSNPDKCPKCGSGYGYYENPILALEQLYNWDGSPIDANDRGRVRGGKRKFCCECKKDVTKYFDDFPL